jgi:hypothetical protein
LPESGISFALCVYHFCSTLLMMEETSVDAIEGELVIEASANVIEEDEELDEIETGLESGMGENVTDDVEERDADQVRSDRAGCGLLIFAVE